MFLKTVFKNKKIKKLFRWGFLKIIFVFSFGKNTINLIDTIVNLIKNKNNFIITIKIRINSFRINYIFFHKNYTISVYLFIDITSL